MTFPPQTRARAPKLDGAALDAKVAERADLITRAKAIAPNVVTDGLDAHGIRRAALAARLTDAEVAGKSDEYVTAYFDIVAKDAGKTVDPVGAALKVGVRANDGANTWNDAAFAAAGVKIKGAH